MAKRTRRHTVFTAPSLPTHYVNRPCELEAVAQLLLKGASSPVAITTALQGGDGFGNMALVGAAMIRLYGIYTTAVYRYAEGGNLGDFFDKSLME